MKRDYFPRLYAEWRTTIGTLGYSFEKKDTPFEVPFRNFVSLPIFHDTMENRLDRVILT